MTKGLHRKKQSNSPEDEEDVQSKKDSKKQSTLYAEISHAHLFAVGVPQGKGL